MARIGNINYSMSGKDSVSENLVALLVRHLKDISINEQNLVNIYIYIYIYI